MSKSYVYYNYKLSKNINLKNEVYILSKDFNGMEIPGINIIDEDFENGIAFRESNHIASMHVDAVFKILVNDNDLTYLNNYTGKLFSDLLIKRYIHGIISNIIDSFEFCQKVANRYDIDENNIIFFCNLYNYNIYKILLNKEIISSKFMIPREIIVNSYVRGIAKSIYLALKILFYPEYIILKTKLKKRSRKKYYNIGFHLFSGNSFTSDNYSIDFFIDNNSIKMNDVIFVLDQPESKEYIKDAKDSSYNVIDYIDIFRKVDSISYIKKYYLYFSTLRLKLFLLTNRLSTLSSAIFNTFRSIIIWELFYHNYHVNYFVRLMIVGEMTSSLVHEKHGVKSILAYTQPTQSLTKIPFNGNCADYSYLYFEMLITDNLSKYWLSNQNSIFKIIIENGSMFSDLIFNPSKLKLNKIKNLLNIKNNKKLITFFDNTVGTRGVLSFSNYLSLLRGIYFILNEIEDSIIIGLKIKKDPEKLKIINNDFIKLFEKIENHSSFTLLNNYKLNAYDYLAASDIIISSPMSSVIGTSLAAKKNTFIFDPNSSFSYDCNIFTKFNNLYIDNHKDLLKQINIALSDKSLTFKNNKSNIKKYIDNYCDGNAIKRFKKILNNGVL